MILCQPLIMYSLCCPVSLVIHLVITTNDVVHNQLATACSSPTDPQTLSLPHTTAH